MITSLWHRPATIERNNFIHKSLSCWAYNVAVGCNHACRFCYVPDASTNRMATVLGKKGVTDPDAQWGDYVFPRTWDKAAFMRSLTVAESTPNKDLNADGNRAVMLCTTTDPYQVIPKETSNLEPRTLNLEQKLQGSTVQQFNGSTVSLQDQMTTLVREALELMLACPMNGWLPLNVRILTRSPLARRDFDLMKAFGKRLLFGMSLPTLNNKLARIYEPKAPAPSQRLETLRAAKAAGIPVYVAVAPAYPECDAADLEATLRAVRELDPVTIFFEPINIRAENVKRIEEHAKSLGVTLKTEVFATQWQWREYAVGQLLRFETIARSLGIADTVLHLWPDKSLGSIEAHKEFGPQSCNWNERDAYDSWLNHHWNKISQWPK